MKRRKLTKFQIFLLICLGAFALNRILFRAPSEAEMIAKFHTHKAEFEQIRLMLQQDKRVEAIGSDWIRAEWDKKNSRDFPLNVSEERLSAYRSFMKRMKLGVIVCGRGRMRFGQFGGGFTDTTWSIGYAWSAKTPQDVVKSAYYQMPIHGLHFSRIKGNWYIYHRR